MVTEAEARLRAEALVRAYCGWHVAPSTREVLAVDGERGWGSVLLPTMYVTALHSVTIGDDVLEASTYTWSPAGILRLAYGSPLPWSDYYAASYAQQPLQNITADVTHGYDEWPPEVAGVIDALAVRAQATPSQYVQVGQVRVATGPDGQPLGAGLAQGDRAVLDRYRLPPRP